MIHRKGLYGRDRVRKSKKGSAIAVSGIGTWSNESGGKNNCDEIAYALNTDSTLVRNQRGNAIIQPLGTGRSSIISQNGDKKSTGLNRGGMSCGAQSLSVGTDDTDTTVSTLGFFQNLALLTWKAQHRVGKYFIPQAVSRRKKFDRSDSPDSLEDILLEEGAISLPPRREQQGFRGNYDNDDDDAIDYFSRAMSTSSNTEFRRSRNSTRNTFFGMSRIAIVGSISVFLVFAFTIYRTQARMNLSRHVIRTSNYISDSATETMDDYIEQSGITTSNHVDRTNGNVRTRSDGAASLHSQHHDIRLPKQFEALANVDDELLGGTGVPFYWHVPRSSGGTVNDVLGR